MSTKKQSDDERADVLLRIPRKTLAKIDQFADKTKRTESDHTSRNTTILVLIDRGLADPSKRMRA